MLFSKIDCFCFSWYFLYSSIPYMGVSSSLPVSLVCCSVVAVIIKHPTPLPIISHSDRTYTLPCSPQISCRGWFNAGKPEKKRVSWDRELFFGWKVFCPISCRCRKKLSAVSHRFHSKNHVYVCYPHAGVSHEFLLSFAECCLEAVLCWK